MAQIPDIDVSSVSVGGSAYTVPFAYQNRSEVFVEVNGVATAFTWINDGNISIVPAPVAGAVVRRYRSTSALAIRHDYRNGVPFTPKNIAENNDQILFVTQEAIETSVQAKGTAEGIAATAAQAVSTANAADSKAQLALDTVQESGVNSFKSRTGAVVPESGDYNSAQVTHNATTVAGELGALGSSITLLAGTTVEKTGATGAAKIPAGTTAERPVAPTFGEQRANSTSGAMEWWDGTKWASMGGSVNDCFYENAQIIAANHTVGPNRNAGTFGAVTIADGVTVTVADGCTWSIV